MNRRFVSEAQFTLEQVGFRVVRSAPVMTYKTWPMLIVYKSGDCAHGLRITGNTVCHFTLEKLMFDAKIERLRATVAELFNEAVDIRIATPAGTPEKARIRAISVQLEKALVHIDRALDRIER